MGFDACSGAPSGMGVRWCARRVQPRGVGGQMVVFGAPEKVDGRLGF